MPRVETVAADTPFGERLATGFGYPLRGAGLATCTALALAHWAGLLPAIGTLASLLVWAATWRYAAECLQHTAHGYANPPDVGVDEAGATGWALTLIHLAAGALFIACAWLAPAALWLLVPILVLAPPAIDMSLAFDGNVLLALNPATWWRTAHGFGGAYLVPVAINLLLGALLALAAFTSHLVPRFVALPLFGFAYTYLIVLAFHLMGALIHQRHERFGLEPEAPKLAEASGQDEDTRLVDATRTLAGNDPVAALHQLADRLRQRNAPAPVHQLYRELLHRQGLRDDLLVHAQIWIAALVAQHEARRALGLVQECCGIDPVFVPDDPRTCGELADLAARLGMGRLAIHLGRGYLAHWPRDEHVPHYGLLVARLLGAQTEHRTEALVLLEKLAAAWPEHPSRNDIALLQRQLAGAA
ncbi:hypothetical protein [Rhodanobacter sp. DHG33]|uniref:hypothetical protein n=1 Tax=Rhodanobacter sp. DHG33 TaxID=2775921 RepID=UPI001783F318|nr:hypothetical protein [Rhodanobacter sp. DHG33]MBD8900278.1 hypothetical protein [Rhodanobacter sp. DHG33]